MALWKENGLKMSKIAKIWAKKWISKSDWCPEIEFGQKVHFSRMAMLN